MPQYYGVHGVPWGVYPANIIQQSHSAAAAAAQQRRPLSPTSAATESANIQTQVNKVKNLSFFVLVLTHLQIMAKLTFVEFYMYDQAYKSREKNHLYLNSDWKVVHILTTLQPRQIINWHPSQQINFPYVSDISINMLMRAKERISSDNNRFAIICKCENQQKISLIFLLLCLHLFSFTFFEANLYIGISQI